MPPRWGWSSWAGLMVQGFTPLVTSILPLWGFCPDRDVICVARDVCPWERSQMKFLFLAFFIINFLISNSYAEDQAKEQKILVGVFSQQYTRLCTGAEDQWVDPHYEVGFIRVIPPEKSKIKFDSYLDQLVIVMGEVDSLYQVPPVQHTGNCQGGQAQAEIKVTKIPALKIKEIKKFEGLRVESTPEEVEVIFENSFLEDLKNVKIIAHYEGCYGKPMPGESSRIFKRLRKRESAFARFPKILQNHAINSIQIYSSNQDILFDFDWPVKEGAEILKECKNNNY